ESNAQVMDAIRVNDRLGRGDGYITGLPATYRKIDAAAVNAAAVEFLQPLDMLFVVVGDKAAIASQLKDVGIAVEYAPSPPSTGPTSAGN
ncbi:MAG: hypothetical protein RLY97_34, partial [Pseudomonadota bacterium]